MAESSVRKVPSYVEEANSLGWRVYEDPDDGSVNFVKELKDGGSPKIEIEWEPEAKRERNLAKIPERKPRGKTLPQFECRSIWRGGDHLSIYPSSQAGCEMGCTFCWLTENRSVGRTHATLTDFAEQLRLALQHHDYLVALGKRLEVKWIYVNFMARGDALNNPTVLNRYRELYDEFESQTSARGLELKMNVSSIFPKASLKRFLVEADELGPRRYDLSGIFGDRPASLYVSLYSSDPTVRRKHMPGAAEVELILDSLSVWQKSLDSRSSRGDDGRRTELAFHGAVIRDLNDSREGIQSLASAVAARNLDGKINVVRFNPHPRSLLTEADRETRDFFLAEMSSAVRDLRGRSKHHEKVGTHVHGSCGEFFPDDELY